MFFVLAGESRDLESLVAELNLNNFFFLLGPVEDVGSYLNSLDIYVQPSHSEGFSNAILEAMLARLPVVVSSVGGNIEIVNHGDDGLLFESKNIEDFCDKIEMILNDLDLSRRMASQANKKILKNFFIQRMLNEYSTFYDGVCSL